MKTTAIFHSADFDGIFCREIARKFLPDAELVGWDFKDEPLVIPDGQIYVLDLPIDRVFGFDFNNPKTVPLRLEEKWPFIWIDHHRSSIETHPASIPGYRIDGVAACRLAWQWFYNNLRGSDLWRGPGKQAFIDRIVSEPLAVRLAGEYDIWDKRDPNAELFQHGLRSLDIGPNTWNALLSPDDPFMPSGVIAELLENGRALQFVRANEYRDVITQQGFDLQFEGLTFLACNSHELDIRSHLFAAGIQPHHDALLGFTYNGKSKDWRVSMYRIDGKDRDILSIAKRHGGGGHPGACGFRSDSFTRGLNFV